MRRSAVIGLHVLIQGRPAGSYHWIVRLGHIAAVSIVPGGMTALAGIVKPAMATLRLSVARAADRGRSRSGKAPMRYVNCRT